MGSDKFKKVQAKLEIMRQLGGKPYYVDFLHVLYFVNPTEKDVFDEDLIKLDQMTKVKKPVSDLVLELKLKSAQMLQKWNNKVDTNLN